MTSNHLQELIDSGKYEDYVLLYPPDLYYEYIKGNNIKLMIEPKTLAEGVEKKTLPRYNRKLTKKTVALLEHIAKNLPEYQYRTQLVSVTGKELKEDNHQTVNDEEIIDDNTYTAYKTVKNKVNHVKKLKKAWEMSNSPFNVIIYTFQFIKNEYKNEWIELINKTFNVNYPPAYLEGEDTTKDWDSNDEA